MFLVEIKCLQNGHKTKKANNLKIQSIDGFPKMFTARYELYFK